METGGAVLRRMIENPSWFRGHPHRWAEASLPLAYAVACIEVVCKKSEKARVIYNEIIETWIKPGIKSIGEEIIAKIPNSEKERVKQAFRHPETEFYPDPNKPFRELEKVITDINDEIFMNDDDADELSLDEKQELEILVHLIFEFIILGFNRESDIKKGRCRVIPSEKAQWLIWAVVLKTLFESYNITFDRIRDFYKLRKYKGKIIDFHKVLTEEPMSRWHRRMVASGKAVKLKLKNDRVIIETARHWYDCRVVFTSINKYCDAPENYYLDPKNISRQIRPCDDAVGYIRRLPKKEKQT